MMGIKAIQIAIVLIVMSYVIAVAPLNSYMPFPNYYRDVGYQVHEPQLHDLHAIHPDNHAPIDYKYGYAVKDAHTGDNKEAWETRHADHVKGSYSLVEPDGTKRIVDYTADPHHGFQAVVKHIGHAHHPQHMPHHGHIEHEHLAHNFY